MTQTGTETYAACPNGPVWRNWDTYDSVKLAYCEAELH